MPGVLKRYDAATSTWIPTVGAPQAQPGLLAVKSYNPATRANYNVTTGWAAIDTTNARVAFTVPASGNVLVKARLATTTTTGQGISIGILESGSLIAGTEHIVAFANAHQFAPRSYVAHITGLTPGVSKTYDLGFIANVAYSSAVSAGGRGYGEPGALVMEVWDAQTGAGVMVPAGPTYTAYTPTLTQGVTVATSYALARYAQHGKQVHAWGKVVASGAGTSGSVITVTLPVTAHASLATDMPIGVGQVTDSGTIYMPAVAIPGSSTTIRFQKTNADSETPIGAAPAFALASGDEITWNITYEAE